MPDLTATQIFMRAYRRTLAAACHAVQQLATCCVSSTPSRTVSWRRTSLTERLLLRVRGTASLGIHCLHSLLRVPLGSTRSWSSHGYNKQSDDKMLAHDLPSQRHSPGRFVDEHKVVRGLSAHIKGRIGCGSCRICTARRVAGRRLGSKSSLIERHGHVQQTQLVRCAANIVGSLLGHPSAASILLEHTQNKTLRRFISTPWSWIVRRASCEPADKATTCCLVMRLTITCRWAK